MKGGGTSEKSHIWETKILSTNEDSNTDTKKILLVRQSLPRKRRRKKMNKFCGHFTPFMSKGFQILDQFFPLLFPRDSENLKSVDIWLWEVGAKRPLNRVRKTNTKKSCSVRQNSPKTNFFWRSDCTPFISKSFKIWDHLFPLLFPKDS